MVTESFYQNQEIKAKQFDVIRVSQIKKLELKKTNESDAQKWLIQLLGTVEILDSTLTAGLDKS